MHWRLYSAGGQDHLFMHGIMSLYKIAIDFECQFEAVNSTYLPVSIPPGTNFKLILEGIPIWYQWPEVWKVTAAEICRTKPTCAAKPGEKKQKKNDGQPPDMIKELFKLEKGTKKKPAKKVVFEVSWWIWGGNYEGTSKRFEKETYQRDRYRDKEASCYKVNKISHFWTTELLLEIQFLLAWYFPWAPLCHPHA